MNYKDILSFLLLAIFATIFFTGCVAESEILLSPKSGRSWKIDLSGKWKPVPNNNKKKGCLPLGEKMLITKESDFYKINILTKRKMPPFSLKFYILDLGKRLIADFIITQKGKSKHIYALFQYRSGKKDTEFSLRVLKNSALVKAIETHILKGNITKKMGIMGTTKKTPFLKDTAVNILKWLNSTPVDVIFMTKRCVFSKI
ncbi:hypothetical protein KAJ27_08555 [bacterium]|nr:hypothetical protein [bacterium]